MSAAALLMLLGAAPVTPPRPARLAPPAYVSGLYGLTFRSPKNSYYCPLPRDWAGSPHGTVIFLRRPGACRGAGFSTSTRYFVPDDVPRIEAYHGYVADPEKPPAKCAGNEWVTLFGRRHTLCANHEKGLSFYSIARSYRSRPLSEAGFTLVTNGKRRSADLAIFRTLLASVRPCRWVGQGQRIGFGAPCPTSASEY